MKSKEEMAVMRKIAMVAKKQKEIELKSQEHLYKLEYMDSSLWQEIASKYKIRMPQYNIPASASGIRKYLKRCKLEKESWEDAFGSIKSWLEHNPRWTLYGAVGLMLEMKL